MLESSGRAHQKTAMRLKSVDTEGGIFHCWSTSKSRIVADASEKKNGAVPCQWLCCIVEANGRLMTERTIRCIDNCDFGEACQDNRAMAISSNGRFVLRIDRLECRSRFWRR